MLAAAAVNSISAPRQRQVELLTIGRIAQEPRQLRLGEMQGTRVRSARWQRATRFRSGAHTYSRKASKSTMAV